MNNRCFSCYNILGVDEHEFHTACSRKLFGTVRPPILPYTSEQILELAKKAVQNQISIPGVQAKLSLDLKAVTGEQGVKKFTIVGFMGEYILKPPSGHYEQLPELENLTMNLADIAGIKTVPHSLIRMGQDSFAYITKRIDRKGKHKIHMEDMAQLTERLTEHKYQGGYEQILRAIFDYSANPFLDAIDFFEVLVFSFLTGNSDMHLKNFSLIDTPQIGYVLSAAYDLVPSSIILPTDKEETALHLNGKKHKLTRKDFITLFNRANLTAAQRDRIFQKMEEAIPAWLQCITASFIQQQYKDRFIALMQARAKRMDIRFHV